jgi:uncharacterized protein (TIGR02145 family)
MKKLFASIATVFLSVNVFAQPPQKMSYQAVIRNSNNDLVVNQNIGIQISILQGSVTGTPVYMETQTPGTNSNGLVTIEIGGGTPVTGTFSAIDWSADNYFIKTEIDPTGSANYTITGTSQLISVPYALYSYTAGTSSDAVKKTGNQTIAGNKTFTGTTTVPTPVNGTDAATKAYVDALQSQITALENKLISDGLIVTDLEGNIYSTVKIGKQTWMAENLKSTRYNDGTAIPLITDSNVWVEQLMEPGYCWYHNDEVTYKNTYGALYKHNTLQTSNICPTGWHVPNDDEWDTLLLKLDPNALPFYGSSIAGGKLKEAGTIHWLSPNTGATNETGFTALPGGYRYHDGTFVKIGQTGVWWSYNLSKRSMSYNDSNVSFAEGAEGSGYSVRCIKDN